MSKNSTIPPHTRLDGDGRLEYVCCYCGKPYARFEIPVFLVHGKTSHGKCMPHRRPVEELRAMLKACGMPCSAS